MIDLNNMVVLIAVDVEMTSYDKHTVDANGLFCRVEFCLLLLLDVGNHPGAASFDNFFTCKCQNFYCQMRWEQNQTVARPSSV